MSTLLNPKGPEPSSVYWIRRGAIVVVVITVLVALWWLIGSLRGGGSDSPATEAGTGSSSAAASAEASAVPEGSSAPSGGASSAPAAITACPDSAIKVTATTDAATYPLGSAPKLTLTIKNTSDVTCKRDVGPKANSLEITSGGYHVWSSDDCNASDKTKITKLQPGQSAVSAITWDGHLSQKGCPNPKGAAAKAGRYAVTGTNDGVTSDPTPFALTAN